MRGDGEARSGMRLDVQGLRAIAVAAVLLAHGGIPGASGGFAGVDVFFVISGFLITGQLLRERERSGRIRFAAFFARRARRLLPAAFVVLAATALAAIAFLAPLRGREVLGDAIAAALYVPNIRFAIAQTDYLAGTDPSPFQHFWSLGVEEQFYLAWPLLIAVVFALGARRRTLALVIAVVAVGSFLSCLALGGGSGAWAFFSPHARAWELAVGALVAIGAGALSLTPRPVGAAVAWAGLAAMVLSIVCFDAGTAWPGWPTLVPVLGTAAVLAMGEAAGGAGPIAALRWRPLGATGRLSYALYLVHWPLMAILAERLTDDGDLPLWLGTASLACAVALAWPLHRFVEEPFRPQGKRATRSAHPSVRVLAASLAGSLVLVIGCAWAGEGQGLRALDAGRPAAEQPTLQPHPAGTAFVPDNLAPALASAEEDTGEVYRDGCQQDRSAAELVTCDFGDEGSDLSVALFGDSHAGRLFPALETAADEEGLRLRTYLKSGCGSLVSDTSWHDARADCSLWREEALESLSADPPDVIVLASHVGLDRGADAEGTESAWESGVEEVLASLPGRSRVVLVQDNPELPGSGPVCLSEHLATASVCDVARSEALNEPVRVAFDRAADDAGAVVVDPVDLLCGERTCPLIIGSTLVYADAHHLTATFGAKLSPVIRSGIERALGEG